MFPLAFACLAVAVPYALTHNLLLPGFALKRCFALVCHQRPERSFWIFGAPAAVCARCLGIYCGAAVGLLLRTTRRTAMYLLLAATALNIADAVTELLHWHGNWSCLRFMLGILLGATAALLIPASARTAATITGRSSSWGVADRAPRRLSV